MAGRELNPFERILASLHEAALDPARWPTASALIDEALGTHGNTLACGDGESDEDYRVYFMWTCLRGQRRQDLERLWLGTYHSVDEGVARLRRRPFYQLIRTTDVYTEDRTFGAKYMIQGRFFLPDIVASGRKGPPFPPRLRLQPGEHQWPALPSPTPASGR